MGNPVVVAEAVDQGDNGMKTCQLTPVGVSFFDGARDSVVPHNSVSRVHTFNDKCGSAKSVAKGSITHGHSCTGVDCCSQCPTFICDLGMLHCPVARAGEGLKGFLQRGRGRPFHLGSNETLSEQAESAAGSANRNPNTGGWGGVQCGPIEGETALLVMGWQGLPFPPCQIGVPFKDVTRGVVQPPHPFCVIGAFPKSKWARQLAVAVPWSNEHVREHALPGPHGCGGGGFEVGPVGGAEDVGVAFALPDVGVDVGSSGIAALGQEGHAEVQSNRVKTLQTLDRPVASHQFIHDEDIRLSTGGDGGQGAFEGKVGGR